MFRSSTTCGSQDFVVNGWLDVKEAIEVSALGMVPLHDRNVVEVRRCHGQVGSWRDSGEGLKVVNEVGLVIVAAVERDLGPFHFVHLMQRMQYQLETAHAAIHFGRKPDLLPEKRNETPLAEPDFLCY